MKLLIPLCLSIASAHALPILNEEQSFTQSPNATGTSRSQVTGALDLPLPEPIPSVSDSFLLFGNAHQELQLPTTGQAQLGNLRTTGYLAVINKTEDANGQTLWTNGDKIRLIRGIDSAPEDASTDNSISTITGASFIDSNDFWICGTLEDPDDQGSVLQVGVSDTFNNGAQNIRYPWDRTGKSGYLMRWDLNEFLPNSIVTLSDPVSAQSFCPTALIAEEDGSVLVMCFDATDNWRIQKHDANGALRWIWNFPNLGAQGIGFVAGQGPERGNFFILAENSSGGGEGLGGQDALLYCITENNDGSGARTVFPWHGTRLGGPAEDQAGPLCTHPDGSLSVTLTITGNTAVFPNLEAADLGDADSEHCLVTNLRNDTNLIQTNWTQPVGQATPLAGEAPGMMRAFRLACDPVGNLHLGIRTQGSYEIECVPRTFNGEGALISIDGTGRVWDCKPLPGVTRIGGIIAPGTEEQIVLGDNGTGLTMRVFSPTPVQDSFLIRAVDPVDEESAIKELVTVVANLGGQVHLEMRHPRFNLFSVSAFLTPAQVAILRADPRFAIDPDPQIITQNSGGGETQSEAGWALRRINDHSDATADPTSSYQFWLDDGIDAQERPRVFLLDTGLPELSITDFSGSRFAPQIPFNPSRPVEMNWIETILEAPIGAEAAEGEYTIHFDSEHAERVTQLMAFQPYGVGQGIPFSLENINIYPDRGTGIISTFPSYIADGIFLAVDTILDERALSTAPQPGALIVIPSSGLSPNPLSDYSTLQIALDEALAADIAIILSAGNTTNAPVEMVVPAGYGNRAGIITMGSTTINTGPLLNARALAQSQDNSGANETITLYAPGVDVPVGNEGEVFSGTSASCAFAAGVASAILSRHPEVAPEVLEDTMIINGVFQDTDQIQLLSLNTDIPAACRFQNWLTSHGISGEIPSDDGDADGLNNLEEFLTGSDPTSPHSQSPFRLQATPLSSAWVAELELPSWAPSDEAPFDLLHLGCDFTVQTSLEWSTDLATWNPETTGSWSVGAPDLARRVTPLLFTVPSSSIGDKRFWRFTLQPVSGP